MKSLLRYSFLALFIAFLTVQSASVSQAQANDTPYIYYYSQAVNGVVIERADGTDSRIIGQGLANEDIYNISGPGWSSDGHWFAWYKKDEHAYGYTVGKGYISSVDGKINLDILSDFRCVYSMLWHPTKNIILVYGAMINAVTCSVDPSPVATYWLLDVDRQVLLASFSMVSSPYLTLKPSIAWFLKESQIQFFGLMGTNSKTSHSNFLVTMFYDGSVTMQPVTEAIRRAGIKGADIVVRYEEEESQFKWWTDLIPPSKNRPPINSSSYGSIDGGQWDTSNKWLLVGFERCPVDCTSIGEVSIFNPETGYSREISNCGDLPACVGWLPERVDVKSLPPGRLTSILPTPYSIDYENTFFKLKGHYGYFPDDVITHEITCAQPRPLTLSSVRNITTGQPDFIIPNAPSCGKPLQTEPEIIYPTQPIIFALSPDKRYYAITNSTLYTSLYDANNGERIATLNFYGIDLSFSEDSQYLIAMGRWATAKWDIETLIQGSLNQNVHISK